MASILSSLSLTPAVTNFASSLHGEEIPTFFSKVRSRVIHCMMSKKIEGKVCDIGIHASHTSKKKHVQINAL